jgi:hypothetical protein
MQIRLHGKPAEINDVLTAIDRVLDIDQISRIYSDRQPSRLFRCYVTATIKTEIKESA